MGPVDLPERRGSGRSGIFIILAIVAVLLGARTIASLLIEYEWWKEVGQVETWQGLILYSFAPVALAALLAFAILWIVHARAMKFAGTSLREYPSYARLSSLALLLIGILIARATLDSWTTVSFYGSRFSGAIAGAWQDPIFGNNLSFYLFDLPFYSQLLGWVFGVTFLGALLFYVTARGWQLVRTRSSFDPGNIVIGPEDLRLAGGLESGLLRGLVALLLLTMAARSFLGRYEYLYDDHGFMVGVDYLNRWFNLPLQWVAIGAFLISAVLILAGRWKLAVLPLALVVLRSIVPPIVSAAYVKPNEISLQREYIENHIHATRAAYGLDARLKEIQSPAQLETKIDPGRSTELLRNVRLWDWRAFHDTVTQLQALRQYYAFADSDVDRYVIDGQLRQVMLTPRELDIRQLPDASANWINRNFIYTHGYGIVMADANKISPNGQPVMYIQDAPPKVQASGLKLERPEIYYGEVTHEPVFVRTQQPEFNYPAGSDNVQTKYQGTGGIPITGFGMRLAAAVANADRNLLLTGVLTPESRMLIRRNVRQRLQTLANFIEWDADPYLVLTEGGRLVWIIDGYTTSSRHPYARRVVLPDRTPVNYIRNSVKATVDAYDGNIQLYVFEPNDPIIRSFRTIFPTLFQDAAAMPRDLRFHVRYPELMFRAQAEIYRSFHMLDPEAFYNREDVWDVARNVYGQNTQPEPVEPSFVMAPIPGGTEPEFLLLQPFTPRNKDNLIGLMLARSDGEHLGEIVVLQLSKQSLIYGPMQIEARIDSDQNISKDLNLWNQQGSRVLRGQTLTLPLQNTFVYIEPIYIQSSQARMPQMKKVVVAMGNTLIYRDTFEEAMSVLTGAPVEGPPPAADLTSAQPAASPPPAAAASPPTADPKLAEAVRDHLRRYREASSQGRWADAGRALEDLEKLVGRR